MKYSPLHIDPEVEQLHLSRFDRFSRWLTRVTHFRFYFELEYGRRSLDAQLTERASFPLQEWEARGFTEFQVKPILDVIAIELELPNANLLPDDPLRIVMTPGYYDFPFIGLHIALNRKIGVVIPFDEMLRLIQYDCKTVESFVRQMLARVRNPQKS